MGARRGGGAGWARALVVPRRIHFSSRVPDEPRFVVTISIDMEAYRALRRRKRKGQSFSDVIKEHFSGGISARAFADVVREAALSEPTLDAIDALIEDRGRDRAGAPEL